MPAKIHGILAAQALGAGADVTIYTVPAGRKATVTANMCNRSTATAARLALLNAALSNAHYIEYDTPMADNGVIERERITLAAGQSILMRAASANVSGVVWGVEEDA